jgi:mannosyltransferase
LIAEEPMTSPGDRAVLARPGGAAAEAAAGRPGFDPGPAWMRLLPPLATLAVMLWGITWPSYWRDEAATLSAVQRPFGNLVRLLGNVDSVHGAYYLTMWPLAQLFGTGELVMRLPSAIAMAGAAAAVAALGRRLVSPRAGLAAGLTFAVLPQISFYGQDARPYALTTALAAAASYLLVRVLDGSAHRRRWLAGYAACIAVLGIVDIFGLLLVVAHAVTVVLRWWRGTDREAARAVTAGWLAAVILACLAASPVIVLGYVQRTQNSWLTSPGLGGLTGLHELIGPWLMTAAAGAVVGCGLLLPALAGGRARLRQRWPPPLPSLCVPWLLVPPGILLAVSAFSPFYTFRYIVFCAPAGALLVGAALAALSQALPGRRKLAGWIVGVAAFAAIAVLGLGGQLGARAPGGHGDDIREVDEIIAATMHPGDAVLYATQVNLVAYRYGLSQLRDIAQAQTPVQSATLVGTDLPAAVVRQRIALAPRLWVVGLHHPQNLALVKGLGLEKVRSWQIGDIWMVLYAHQR